MDEVIYLEPDDDIVALRDRLEWAEGRRVLVVLPKRSRTLADPISMKLLRRHADGLSLDVALVALDGETRRLAQAEGIPAFRRVPKKWWRLGRGVSGRRRSTERLRRPRGFPSASEIGRDLASRWAQLAAFLLLLVLLAALVATVIIVVPVAKIVLVPTQVAVEVEVPVVADPSQRGVDFEAGRVPARLVEDQLEGTAQIPTSSRHDSPDLPARGTVVFVNLTSEEVEVPMGTVVRTSTGTTVRFTTVQTVTVPGPVGGRSEAEVQALNPGPVGNVEKNLINRIEGGLALRLTVTNEKPTSGGTVKQVGLVTYADKDRLRSSVLQKVQQEALTRLQGRLEAHEFLLPESIKVTVTDEAYDPPLVEVESDVLRVVMRARVQGLAVSEQATNEVALRALEAQAGRQGRLLPQRVSFARGGPVTVLEEGKQATFVVRARGVVLPEVDLNLIREAIAGAPVEDARRWMENQLPLAEPPGISVTPNWLGRIPWLPFRIHLFVEAKEG